MIPNSQHYEWLSALQKCIRRSMTEDAGYWFFALAESGFVSMALNRLRIIAHEDIGGGDPAAVMFACRCVDDAQEWHRAKNDAWKLAGANAILTLCRAKKSREADHFQAVCRCRFKQNPDKQVPDFALDKHTRKGRQMGRGFDHFFSEGGKLVNPDGQDVPHDQWHDEAAQAFKSGLLDGKPEQDTADKEDLFGRV